MTKYGNSGDSGKATQMAPPDNLIHNGKLPDLEVLQEYVLKR